MDVEGNIKLRQQQCRQRSREYYERHKEDICARKRLKRQKRKENQDPQTGSNASDDFTHKFEFKEALKRFRHRIDALGTLQTCTVCKESYPGMPVSSKNTTVTCRRCQRENGIHRFTHLNNMDPGEQPAILARLTQVEEMLIARVNPILQVTHATGGQYKYHGHTISFPQDISQIAKELPHKIQDLDVLIVSRSDGKGHSYECYVSRNHVQEALEYKIRNDPLYRDVIVNADHLSELPEQRTNVANIIHTIEIVDDVINKELEEESEEECIDNAYTHTSSFVPAPHNKQ